MERTAVITNPINKYAEPIRIIGSLSEEGPNVTFFIVHFPLIRFVVHF